MNHKKIRNSFVLQQDQSDCGVACLLSIIRYHGGDNSFENLRELSGTNRQGTTILGLYQAGKDLGFNTKGLEAERTGQLKSLQSPAILHISGRQSQHYLVYYGFDKDNKIVVGDPLKGILHYTENELEKLWRSKALIQLIPNSSFALSHITRKLKIKWILDLIKKDLNTLLIIIFLGLLLSVLGLTTAIFSQKLIDIILPSHDSFHLFISLIFVAVLLILKAGISYLRGYFIIHQLRSFSNRLVINFFSRLIYLQKSFFDTRKTGEVVARINDTATIESTVSVFVGTILIDFLMLLVFSSVIFMYHWIVGMITLSIVPIYIWIIIRLNHKILQNQKEVMQAHAINESNYVDTIQGITTIKVMNVENTFLKLTKRIYKGFQEKILSMGKFSLFYNFLSEFVSVIFLLAVFSVSAWFVLIEELLLGQMMAITALSGTIISSIMRLSSFNVSVQGAKVAFNRMYEFTDLRTENNQQDSSITIHNFQVLKVDKLTFRFPGRKAILKNFSIHLEHGEIISLVGESGCGKSTFLNILEKFYTPEQGSIEVNNTLLSKINTKNWRNTVTTVSQEVKIFNGTLLFNICLNEDQNDLNDIVHFCQKLGFDRFFLKWPLGLFTLLGEEGQNISGGERQLVALARALYRRPKLLLLDEATSSMDRNTENFVMDLLLSLKQDLGILMVTHRINTASVADRIYVMENGMVSDFGTFNELLKRPNFLSQSYKDQISFNLRTKFN